MPAVPLHPHTWDNSSGTHWPVLTGIPTFNATQFPIGWLCFSGKPTHNVEDGQPATTPRAWPWLSSAANTSGSRLLLFASQPGPAATTGDQSPSEHSTAPRDNETTVPAPRASNYHHCYYSLMRGAASLNRLLLWRQSFPLLGLKSAEYFRR